MRTNLKHIQRCIDKRFSKKRFSKKVAVHSRYLDMKQEIIDKTPESWIIFRNVVQYGNSGHHQCEYNFDDLCLED
jgi:hypothetical protein